MVGPNGMSSTYTLEASYSPQKVAGKFSRHYQKIVLLFMALMYIPLICCY